MIDELPEFPPTFTLRERDSETRPNMTRDNTPAQASVDRLERTDQSGRKRDPAEIATMTAMYTRSEVLCMRESPPRLASLKSNNTSEEQCS